MTENLSFQTLIFKFLIKIHICRPTPRVDWARLDGKNMPDRARQESFGQELVIEKVRMDDAGEYECQGINDATQTPTRRSFSLKVEGLWIVSP